ncbi:efflux RND transporter permease subunit [Bacteriovoracaceae bacterium]|nr:efflux RND transporter permease subunit [Bacteriovoracaceae bacterium]
MSEFAVRRPVTIVMICLGLLVLGAISASRIQFQLLPDISSTEFKLVTRYDGATPAEVESLITSPIERAVSTTSGLYYSDSESVSGLSIIELKFKSNVDILETMSILRDKIDSADLPEEASKSKIVRFQAGSDPVIRLSISRRSNTLSQIELAEFIQNELVRKLESQQGIAVAQVQGKPTQSLEIIANPLALFNYEIPLSAIPDAIKKKNKTYPGGSIEYLGKSNPVKLGEPLHSIQDLKSLVVKRKGNQIVYLSDIAKVAKRVEKPSIRTHLQGRESLIIEIQKEASANTVAVAKNAKLIIGNFLEENKKEIKGVVLYDQGKEVKSSIDNVIDAVINGGVLAALVIFIFLQSAGPTAIVALSIPMSLTITLILMYFTGVSFNLMSLGGLALGVGMLVDNSIVVLENISRMRTQLDDIGEAAIWGTKKVSSAITSSTLTTIAVFAPLIFVEGMVGQIFKDISLTVVYSLISSLFVAIIVIPMLSATKFGSQKMENNKENSILNALQPFKDFYLFTPWWKKPFVLVVKYMTAFFLLWKIYLIQILKGIGQILNWAYLLVKNILTISVNPILLTVSITLEKIQNMYAVNLERYLKKDTKPIIFICLLFGISVVIFLGRGAELFPADAASRLEYSLEFPSGQILDATEDRVSKIEEKILKLKGVSDVASISGRGGDNLSRLLINLDPKYLDHINRRIQHIFNKVTSLKFKKNAKGLMGGEKPLEVQIYSPDLSILKNYSREALKSIETIGGIIDIESDIKSEIFELDIEFNHQDLSKYQIDSEVFIEKLKHLISGIPIGNLEFENKEYNASVRIPNDFFSNIESIKYFAIPFEEKKLYLSQVAKISQNKVFGQIKHVNRKRVIAIKANLDGIDLDSATKKIAQVLNPLFKGQRDVMWKIGGLDLERKKSEQSLMIAIGLSIFLIYLLLASQFENFKQPFIILFAVPLCLVGVAFFLFMLNLNVSALVLIGFVILAGLSVNTSIVLVDTMNQNIMGGMALKEAILQASKNRLRPILMTACSTIIGLLPMALAMGQGAGMRQPLAITVISGLISSTILTLIIVPIVYKRMSKVSLA